MQRMMKTILKKKKAKGLPFPSIPYYYKATIIKSVMLVQEQNRKSESDPHIHMATCLKIKASVHIDIL